MMCGSGLGALAHECLRHDPADDCQSGDELRRPLTGRAKRPKADCSDYAAVNA